MTDCPFPRYAVVETMGSRATVEAYLPDNYRVIHEHAYSTGKNEFILQGKDKAGWTLDGYVIPRLGSGLHQAKEIDLSHPLMKRVPQDAVIEPFNPADRDESGRGLGEINAEEET